MQDLLRFTSKGIYCELGDFHIDPWKPTEKAVITHAHADHARPGNSHYLGQELNRDILKLRINKSISFQGLKYGEPIQIGSVKVSLHPAGHIPGSAQVRVEHKGEVWVASGDYKRENDGLSSEFEVVKCDTFISESTFGLPLYHWKPQKIVFSEMSNWLKELQAQNKNGVIYAYSLGKAQRIIKGLSSLGHTVFTNPVVEEVTVALEKSGLHLPQRMKLSEYDVKQHGYGNLVVAPPSSDDSSLAKKIGEFDFATASGWMQLRGARKWMSNSKGFVLSDHADWEGLISTIVATGAQRVIATHGFTAEFSRFLREKFGLNAHEERTLFEGEVSL